MEVTLHSARFVASWNCVLLWLSEIAYTELSILQIVPRQTISVYPRTSHDTFCESKSTSGLSRLISECASDLIPFQRRKLQTEIPFHYPIFTNAFVFIMYHFHFTTFGTILIFFSLNDFFFRQILQVDTFSSVAGNLKLIFKKSAWNGAPASRFILVSFYLLWSIFADFSLLNQICCATSLGL